MFFGFFHNPYRNKLKKTIIYTLITGFAISISGCESTKNIRESSEYIELFKNKKVEVTQIVFKDGTFIETSDKAVFFYPRYKDSTNVLLYIQYDTIKITENGKTETKLSLKENIVPLSSVKEVYISRSEIDAGNTILFVAGTAVIAGIGVMIAAVSGMGKVEHNSCPYIYSFDGEAYRYDAEPLSGAVCEGLARTDYSRLEYLKPSECKFKILVRNENEEQQHIDEMKLMCIKHDSNMFVTQGQDNNFYEYRHIEQPVSVTDENANDITTFFQEKDNVKWQTDLPIDNTVPQFAGNHKLHFRFLKPDNTKSAMLYFNGGISEWGSRMVKKFLKLRGNKTDEWYKSIYPGSNAQKELYSLMLNEQLYYLKVNILSNGEYVQCATIRGAGPLADEDVLLNIPLDNINGDYIDIELNPAAGFWKFDKVGMIYKSDRIDSKDISILESTSAYDNNMADISEKLSQKDNNNLFMPETNSSFYITYDVPKDYDKLNTALFLKTSGWYEIITDKSSAPRADLFKKFIEEPGSIIRYAMEMISADNKNTAEKYKCFYN